jgi:hypothetical protein
VRAAGPGEKGEREEEIRHRGLRHRQGRKRGGESTFSVVHILRCLLLQSGIEKKMPFWWFSEPRSQIKRARGLVYRNLETVTPNTVLLSLAFVCSTVGYHTTHCQRFCFLPRTNLVRWRVNLRQRRTEERSPRPRERRRDRCGEETPCNQRLASVHPLQAYD